MTLLSTKTDQEEVVTKTVKQIQLNELNLCAETYSDILEERISRKLSTILGGIFFYR